MRTVFFDASYVLALEVANDQNHRAATEHWRKVDAAGLPIFVTTTYVFSEVVTYLNRRALHAKAVEAGENLLNSPNVRLIPVDEALFEKAWEFFLQHQDKRYSLTDCASFFLMHELDISTSFAFDHHFRQAGFDVEPQRRSRRWPADPTFRDALETQKVCDAVLASAKSGSWTNVG